MSYKAKFVKCTPKWVSYWVVYDSNNNTLLLKNIKELVGEHNVDLFYDIIASAEFGHEILVSIKTIGLDKTIHMMSPYDWDDEWFGDYYLTDDDDEEEIPDTKKVIANVKPKGKVGDGMICASCKDYFPFAEPNQPDGSLMCYKCRNNL